MPRTHRKFIAVALTGILLLAACSPAAPKTTTPDANAVFTQAAGTVAAQLTQSSPAATPTPEQAKPEQPTNTLAPAESAAQPTLPPAAANTPAANAPTATVAANPPASTQDNGSFVADVTIPDDTGAAPGIPFVKTWKIKNAGTTTWTANYSLVPIDGDHMGSPDSIPMPTQVRPGEEVEISVKLTAPTKPGSYKTYFRLRNANGQFFRLDKTGDLWVKIVVGGVTATPNMTETAVATPATQTPTPTSTP